MRFTGTLLLSSLCLLLFCTGCGTTPDAETLREFHETEQAFAAAVTADDFARVASRYEELTRRIDSGAMLYNQGNAWMRAGQTGRAIAAWRQSQVLRPRDPWLQANLQAGLTACHSSAALQPDTGIAGYLLFWQNWLSYREKFIAATWMLGLAGVALVVLPPLTGPRVTRRITTGAGILFTVMAGSALWDWQRIDGMVHGVVVQPQVEARKGNSDTYEVAFTKPLTEGTEFTVVEERPDWLNVQIPEAGTAWIPRTSAVLW